MHITLNGKPIATHNTAENVENVQFYQTAC